MNQNVLLHRIASILRASPLCPRVSTGANCVEVYDAHGARFAGVYLDQRVWWYARWDQPTSRRVSTTPFAGPMWADRLANSLLHYIATQAEPEKP